MHLIWTSQLLPVTGLGFGVLYPGTISPARQLEVQSSAVIEGVARNLHGLQLFLTGDANSVSLVQQTWSSSGGGLQISFDKGTTFVTFDNTHGLESSTATYLTVPRISMGAGATDGLLIAGDIARFLVRLIAPQDASTMVTYDLSLDAIYDIV